MSAERRMDREVRGYLQRRLDILRDVVESARVFSKKYNDALDELEELGELLGVEVD